jgi:CBS domain-containing protein
MLVRDVLQTKNREVHVIVPEEPVREAVRRLDAHNIGSLPVVDAEGRPIGIFTERDVLRGVAEDCEGFSRRTVGEVMTRDPICCNLTDDVQDAMGRLSEHRIGQLPVLAGDTRVIGVVSVGDLIRLLYEKADSENRQLFAYIHGGS